MIRVFDRAQRREIVEEVYGGKAVDWAYQTGLGRLFSFQPIVQRCLSRGLGVWNDSRFSRYQIKSFVERYKIPLGDFVVPVDGFPTFNDFFIRKFKIGKRNFPSDPDVMGAPAEGRLSVFRIDGPLFSLHVKGKKISLAGLINSDLLAREFIGGSAFVFRLCPTDYHCFHFPDDGVASVSRSVGGALHSVNPVAHEQVDDIFLRNERQVCTFDSKNFGRLMLIEVGALGVGKIVQSYKPNGKILRGEEKGCFLFGGSTVIMLTEANKVMADPDLLVRSQSGGKSLVRLGESIASRLD